MDSPHAGLERAWRLVAKTAGALCTILVCRRGLRPALLMQWADDLREAADVLDSLRTKSR